MHIIVHIFST